MFILLEYIAGGYENLCIVSEGLNEETVFFDSEEDAELYGAKNCVWNYQAVKLN